MSGREKISVFVNSMAGGGVALEKQFQLDKGFQEYSYVLQPVTADVASVEVLLNFAAERAGGSDGLEPCAVVKRVGGWSYD